MLNCIIFIFFNMINCIESKLPINKDSNSCPVSYQIVVYLIDKLPSYIVCTFAVGEFTLIVIQNFFFHYKNSQSIGYYFLLPKIEIKDYERYSLKNSLLPNLWMGTIIGFKMLKKTPFLKTCMYILGEKVKLT